jgi:hypothetical protein
MRDDISYIDGASAVLSAGNGKAFSVRSSKLSKRSIVTPASYLSVTTSVFDTKSLHSTTHSSSRSK